MTSVDPARYVGLIGLYVRLERIATEEEREIYGCETMGGEGICEGIESRGPQAVALILDAHAVILRDDHEWLWSIYARNPYVSPSLVSPA